MHSESTLHYNRLFICVSHQHCSILHSLCSFHWLCLSNISITFHLHYHNSLPGEYFPLLSAYLKFTPTTASMALPRAEWLFPRLKFFFCFFHLPQEEVKITLRTMPSFCEPTVSCALGLIHFHLASWTPCLSHMEQVASPQAHLVLPRRMSLHIILNLPIGLLL